MLAVETVNGCVDTTYNEIDIMDHHTFYAPTAFTPESGHEPERNGTPAKFQERRLGNSKSVFRKNVFERGGADIEIIQRQCILGYNIVLFHQQHLITR